MKSAVVRFKSVAKKVAASNGADAKITRFVENAQSLLKKKEKALQEVLNLSESLEKLAKKAPGGIPARMVKIMVPKPARKSDKPRKAWASNRGQMTYLLRKLLAEGPKTIPELLEGLGKEGYKFAEGRDPYKIVNGALRGKSWATQKGDRFFLVGAPAFHLHVETP